MVNSFIRLRILGIVDHAIERVYNVDTEVYLHNILKEVLKGQDDIIDKISEKLLEGRFMLIINGLTIYRFTDIKSIKVKPGDEVAIMPVVFGGCKQL